MDSKPFFCRKESEGATIGEYGSGQRCKDQCASCLRNERPVDETHAKATEHKEPEKVVQMPQPPAGPQVRAQLVITLFDDGNMRVDGPFEDRLLFRGMLEIARDVEQSKHMGRMLQANMLGNASRAAGAQAKQGESRFQKFMRERREKKAREERDRRRSKDELQKALAQNASSGAGEG